MSGNGYSISSRLHPSMKAVLVPPRIATEPDAPRELDEPGSYAGYDVGSGGSSYGGQSGTQPGQMPHSSLVDPHADAGGWGSAQCAGRRAA